MLHNSLDSKSEYAKVTKDLDYTVVTAGSTYLDIDAYASMVALKELLELKGQKVIAYSTAPYNYSVCDFLVIDGQITNTLPQPLKEHKAKYIIVDVSDPDYIKDLVDLNSVVEVYDHHTGFEDFWEERIGANSHIEFIGAAATLIYREWKKAGLQEKIKHSTVLLLIAAILDNTLNLTSSNTTLEDIQAFRELCQKEGIGEQWCDLYFSEVQKSVETDLKNALFGDIKTIKNQSILPSKMAQLCIWNAQNVFEYLPQIRKWFSDNDSWMINLIDVKQECSYFVCDNAYHQEKLGDLFDVKFKDGVAKCPVSYLRKQIIKKANQG